MIAFKNLRKYGFSSEGTETAQSSQDMSDESSVLKARSFLDSDCPRIGLPMLIS
jgi:hypothetical protein